MITKKSNNPPVSLGSVRDYILFQDHHILVANKPAGIPVQEDKTKDVSLHRMLQAYCKQDLWLLNRLDRPVSGLVLFAKNPDALARLHAQMMQHHMHKTYIALVEKKDIPQQGILKDQLVKSGFQNKSKISSGDEGKDCELSYKVLEQLDHYLILEIKIQTGRFHQIRAQMAHLGTPIKSDVKYGARRGSADRSIGLHAWQLDFIHPSTGKAVHFKAPFPQSQLWPLVQKVVDTL